MNERQFDQIVRNCGPKRLEPLFGGRQANIVLKAAARSVRKCNAVRRVLEEELTPALSAACEIGAGGQGMLELLPGDMQAFAELRRKQKQLEARLRRVVPGVRRVILRPPGWKPPTGEGAATAETESGRSEA